MADSCPSFSTAHQNWPAAVVGNRKLPNTIFYVLRGGVPWRMPPKHFPPCQTIYCWLMRFLDDGLWKSLSHHLVTHDCERAGSRASLTVAVINTQNVKTTEVGWEGND